MPIDPIPIIGALIRAKFIELIQKGELKKFIANLEKTYLKYPLLNSVSEYISPLEKQEWGFKAGLWIGQHVNESYYKCSEGQKGIWETIRPMHHWEVGTLIQLIGESKKKSNRFVLVFGQGLAYSDIQDKDKCRSKEELKEMLEKNEKKNPRKGF